MASAAFALILSGLAAYPKTPALMETMKAAWSRPGEGAGARQLTRRNAGDGEDARRGAHSPATIERDLSRDIGHEAAVADS